MKIKKKNIQNQKYTKNKSLQKKIDSYFEEECKTEVIKDDEGRALMDKRGRPVVEVNPPTVSGLARYLGFQSRQSMYDYKGRDQFSYAIKETMLRIEEFAEKQEFIQKASEERTRLLGLWSKSKLDEAQKSLDSNQKNKANTLLEEVKRLLSDYKFTLDKATKKQYNSIRNGIKK